MIAMRLTRDVTMEECKWLHRDLKKGELVAQYKGHTYGCISPSGIACTEREGEWPFFELPEDALTFDMHESD